MTGCFIALKNVANLSGKRYSIIIPATLLLAKQRAILKKSYSRLGNFISLSV